MQYRHVWTVLPVVLWQSTAGNTISAWTGVKLGNLKLVFPLFERAGVRSSFITTTVRDESQVESRPWLALSLTCLPGRM